MRRVVLLMAVLGLASCSRCGAQRSVSIAFGERDGSADVPDAPEAPPSPTEAGEEAAPSHLAESVNAFAMDLWGQLRSAEGNLAVAPASLSMALTMTWAGSTGATSGEMAQVLHVDRRGAGAVHEAASGLLKQWNRPGRRDYEIRVANRLFGEQSYPFEQDFVALTSARYAAPLEGLDFVGDAPGAREHVNGWVARRTKNRIEDVLPEGSVTPETALVLVNAVYFKGQWLHPFDRTETRPAPFRLSAEETVEVPTMHRVAELPFHGDDEVLLVVLPYVGEELAMTLMLPADPDGLAALEEGLDPERLAQLLEGTTRRQVAVALPRFTLAPGESLPLRQPLSALGMPAAFDPETANFSRIADPDDRPGPFIGGVFHRVFLAVDEEGTEAAAASAATGVDGAPAPPSFTADRPFLFIVRDLRSGLILFMGRVADPR